MVLLAVSVPSRTALRRIGFALILDLTRYRQTESYRTPYIVKSFFLIFQGIFSFISQMNEPRRWTFLCIWYENRGVGVHKIKRHHFRSTWPCVYPPIYGSEPPMSTRIINLCWVLTSLVPPVHNQGVSLAPLQGLALWCVFLPTTGSFFVCCITDFFPATAPFGGRFPVTF